ncbi:hypothetical protein D9M70_537640 [compost metagenome]
MRDGEVCGTGIKKHGHARLDQSDRRAGKCCLALRRHRHPLAQTAVCRGNDRERATIDPLAKPRCRHFAQVTADRVFGNIELGSEIRSQHPALGLQPLLDQRLSLTK